MDSELAVLATSSATTLVGLVATEAWIRAKDSISHAYARFHPASADSIEVDLEETERELTNLTELTAQEIQQEYIKHWTNRFRILLLNSPEAAIALKGMVEELSLQVPPAIQNKIEHLEIHGTANGHGRIYQQGLGTQNNTES